MTEFIIASVSDNDRYICYDKLGKMSITNRKEKAVRFQDSGKAWRVLTTQMAKKKRDDWKVIAYEKEEPKKVVEEASPKRFHVNIDISAFVNESFDWEKVRKNITDSFADIIAYKERLSSDLAQVEAELCDCEHACEFLKCDAAHGYKLYAMIRERRIKRRHLKDELWRANSVLGMSYTDIANGGIENAFNEITRQEYEPRVLKDLFSDMMRSTTAEKQSNT